MRLYFKKDRSQSLHAVDLFEPRDIFTRNVDYSRTCYDLFWGAFNHNNFYFLILLLTSLHVSASTGHPQVKYTVVLKAITHTTDPF
jgi:hypothetical protein